MALAISIMSENEHRVHPFFVARSDAQDVELDVDPNSDRRKRQRTVSPHLNDLNLPSSVTRRPDNTQIEPDVPDINLTMSLDATSMNSSNVEIDRSGEVNPTATVVGGSVQPFESIMVDGDIISDGFAKDSSTLDSKATQLLTSPPKKMLKVRSDGTLLSPKRQPHIEEAKKTKRGRPPRKAQRASTNIVIIKYGLGLVPRKVLGDKIEAIFASRQPALGPERGPCPAERPTLDSSKPAHPFFTGGIVHGAGSKTKINDGISQTNSTDRSSDQELLNIRNKKRMTVISRPAGCIASDSAQDQSSFPSFGTDHARALRFPGAKDPLWPPANMVRIEPPLDVQGPVPTGKTNAVETSQGRKLKQVQIKICADEDILASYQNMLPICKQYLKSPVEAAKKLRRYRRPQRLVMTGSELQQLVLPRLVHIFKAQPVMSPSHEDELNGPPSMTPLPTAPHCLRRVYEKIAHKRTAFDLFTCESTEWMHKYAPKSSSHVLQQSREIGVLRDWLASQKVSSVKVQGASGTDQAPKPRRKKKRKDRELADFIVSSDEEADIMGELSDTEDGSTSMFATAKTMLRTGENQKDAIRGSNAVVVSGPHGCGKTATIWAVARELDFEIFEINPGSRRSGKDILEKVGNMTKNHLVRQDQATRVQETEDQTKRLEELDQELNRDLQSGRQGTMNSFFKSTTGPKSKLKLKQKTAEQSGQKKGSDTTSSAVKVSKDQKQSVILLEEVDVLFEEDKPFWNVVLDMIYSSKRPVIMTCTDESRLPLHEMSLHCILRLSIPSEVIAIDYLLLVACNEGHLLSRDAVTALWRAKRSDLRACLAELQFFCQMALGDTRGGLDWMLLDSSETISQEDQPSMPARVISQDTYRMGMGWLGDLQEDDQQSCSTASLLATAARIWGLDLKLPQLLGQSPDNATPYSSSSKIEILLKCQTQTENDSVSDLLAGHMTSEYLRSLDASQPRIAESARRNYIDGYPLLEVYGLEDTTGVSMDLATTIVTLTERSLDQTGLLQPIERYQTSLYDAIVKQRMCREPTRLERQTFSNKVFEPIARPPVYNHTAIKAPQISCFDQSFQDLTLDTAPIVRSIVQFDLRLEEQRRELNAMIAEPGRNGAKARRTRAARAALEGGNKASTRKERWFPHATNYDLIMQTGSPFWRDAALPAIEEAIFRRLEPQYETQNTTPSSSMEDIL